ncbi:MAG: PVC-type heme-binding CxxCH protein [Prosthecobacter sp.]|uniref:PVC-type heme-binding CxxCH protein n=1 Tax=Prosthecobacter sp. TaxID=1965333 RepID=UPI0038FFAD3B
MHRSLLFLLPQALFALDFPTTPPVEPQAAAKTFHVLDGFEMQLIAAEPLVTDPVAMTYDADGRAYVSEMNDYPYTDKEHHKHAQENPTDQAIGKVRLLTDTDGDGTFDKATVFADGLSWPTGAACWKGGIFVTATPDVWYLKDTNDDGVADVRQKVFTGFKKLNVQAVMNNPIWGLDHRIYIAGGSNGGEIQRVPGSESVMPLPKDFKPLSIKRNDFSFDPSTGDVRLESGGARFGNTFDDWGNRFLCNIRNPCQHVVLPYRYLARNPYLVVPSALNDCAEAGDQLPVYRTSPAEPWREFRAKRWVQEGSTLPKSELVGAGVVTSSSGITVYRGDAYPKEYRDFAFVADVAGNLFYRMKLVPDGVTFKAVQVDGTKNFCTSDDLWFRPVNFVNAPDGCLHVCDMYREVIEHPWSIPDDIHSAVDLLRGRDKGRIWRLTPKKVLQGFSSSPSGLKPRTTLLSQASTKDLVTLLDHANAWHRETAQRLLFERQDKTAAEPLRELVKSGKTAQGKIVALWALQTLSQLNAELVNEVCNTRDEHVQETAAELFEPFVSAVEWHDNGERLSNSNPPFANLLGSGSERVRLKAMYAIRDLSVQNGKGNAGGFWTSSMQNAAFFTSDPWFRYGLLGVASDRSKHVLTGLLLNRTAEDRSSGTMIESLVDQVAARDDKAAIGVIVTALSRDRFSNELRAGLLRILHRHSSRWPFTLTDTTENTKTLNRLLVLGAQARRAFDQESSSDGKLRELAIAVALLPQPDALSLTKSLIAPAQPQDLQLAALEALGSYREPAVADMLIDAWSKLTPTLRDKATTILLSRTDRIAKLLDAIEAKKITPAQLSAAAKATLGRQKTPALAERIAKLIGDGGSSNRKEVIERYAKEMGLRADEGIRAPGDATRGAKIHEMACMVCHKFADKGNDVGPHLGTIKAWPVEQILTNVLDPNREVSPNFALYIVETNDGRTLSGLIASETAGNLTLKRADGGTDTVLRSEIKSLTSPGISLMPEGLEAAITPQQMADLIAYLKQ